MLRIHDIIVKCNLVWMGKNRVINLFQKNVLILALHAGEILLKSGSEIYRVEDTVTRICKACRIKYVEVFATTSSIFLSVDTGSYDTPPYTVVKRIKSTTIDLEKVSKVNDFSRKFANENISVEEGRKILKEIEQSEKFSLHLQILGAALIASFFTLMFGGNWKDFGCSLIIGTCVYTLALFLDRLKFNLFTRNFCACALCALLSLFAIKIGIGANLNPIIIGSIMIFLPGIAITNAVRDSLAGDLLAGSARATEAALIAVSIAAGVGIVLFLWVFIGGAL